MWRGIYNLKLLTHYCTPCAYIAVSVALCNHSVSALLNPLRKREFCFCFFLQAEEHVCVSLPRCLAWPLHVRHASCHESVLAFVLCTTVKLDLLSLNCRNAWHSLVLSCI